MKDSGKAFKNPEGRPPGRSKQRDIIMQYRQDNPQATIKDCISDTGIGRSTVYRWWEDAKTTHIRVPSDLDE